MFDLHYPEELPQKIAVSCAVLFSRLLLLLLELLTDLVWCSNRT